MSGGPPLERSVLERKERGELHVIADSLGLNPTARLRKAELIDRILEATGAPPAEAQPVRELVAVGAGDGTADPGAAAVVPPLAAAQTGDDEPAAGSPASTSTAGDAPPAQPSTPAVRADGERAEPGERQQRPPDARGAERSWAPPRGNAPEEGGRRRRRRGRERQVGGERDFAAAERA